MKRNLKLKKTNHGTGENVEMREPTPKIPTANFRMIPIAVRA
jgi:hypothetical protein